MTHGQILAGLIIDVLDSGCAIGTKIDQFVMLNLFQHPYLTVGAMLDTCALREW